MLRTHLEKVSDFGVGTCVKMDQLIASWVLHTIFVLTMLAESVDL
jgi:hypothetical protein